jgi:hypothetical protein
MSEVTKTAWRELLPVPQSVSLASSIQLSIPIRVDLTLTTWSYRCSHSLTVESSTLVVCLLRSEG